jgi:hypothetical protein
MNRLLGIIAISLLMNTGFALAGTLIIEDEGAALEKRASPSQSQAPSPAASVTGPPKAPPPPEFSVGPVDSTIREVLVRWSAQAGWMHSAAHWTVSKDHPVEGAAGPEVFGASFQEAVRILVSSTELTDQPVQPCFYSNRVLRIISATASCNRVD